MDTTSPSITVPSDIEIEIYDKMGIEIDTGIAISDDIIDSNQQSLTMHQKYSHLVKQS